MVSLYYDLGVRWMLLGHSKRHGVAHDSGLTAPHRQIIDEVERLGMVLCLRDVGHRTAREAIEYARQPMMFLHSNPSAGYPHASNVPDELKVACARHGGVVSINGAGMFPGKGDSGQADNSTEALVRHVDHAVRLIGAQHVSLGVDCEFDSAQQKELVQKHPQGVPPEVLHSGGDRPAGPRRVALIAESLLMCGYGEADVQGILGHNNLRVARGLWR